MGLPLPLLTTTTQLRNIVKPLAPRQLRHGCLLAPEICLARCAKFWPARGGSMADFRIVPRYTRR
jgi:hypothetical protein